MKSQNGGGYFATSYIRVLEENILNCFSPGMTFMKDNARIHTAKKINAWIEENAIPQLEWPPYSPDLNPIEHVWAKMKEYIVKHHPELSTMGKSQVAYDEMARAIIEAWEAIPQSYIDGLIESMGRRCQAVRSAKGWHTKY